MENKLKPIGSSMLQTSEATTNINLPGDGNTLVAHADNVNNEYRVVMLPSGATVGTDVMSGTAQNFNPNYYNLIVVGDDDLCSNHFLVRKDRSLTESTSLEIKESCAALSEEAITRVKSFPALIATENHQYGKTDVEHQAVYGMLTDIKVQDNGIKIYYQVLNKVSQQKMNELAYELGLGHASAFNELNRMHWAIKQINLVEVLKDAGIRVFALA